MKPVLFLRSTISGISVSSTTTVNGTTGIPNKWNATLAVVAQAHSDSTTTTPYFYNGNDVKVGDFITTSGDGKSLKISAITTKSANSVVCILEDDQSLNALSDETGNLDGMIPTGAGITAYIFEVNNNVPVIANVPAALPGNIPVTFAQNIKSRFENTYGASNKFSAATLNFGDGTTGNQSLVVDTGSANKPALSFTNGAWKFSNDGTTYQVISTTYTHPSTDGSLHVPATGTTNNTKVLKAGSSAGSFSWGQVLFSELGSVPANLTTISSLSASSTGLVKFTNGVASLDSSSYLTTTAAGTTYATLSNAALTGTPTAPTATAGTNTTQLATTAFVNSAINSSNKVLSFTLAFNGSAPSSTAPTDLPSGWTYVVSGNDVTITHTVGKPLALLSYWGVSTTGGVARYRLPSASNEASMPLTSMNTQFTFRVSTAVAGADTDGTAKVIMVF